MLPHGLHQSTLIGHSQPNGPSDSPQALHRRLAVPISGMGEMSNADVHSPEQGIPGGHAREGVSQREGATEEHAYSMVFESDASSITSAAALQEVGCFDSNQ